MSTSAWGLAPGIRLHQQQALKARFNQAGDQTGFSELNRAFSASPLGFHGLWGVALGWE
jgi:hypothetical protein